jgi:hypothetical protein
MSESIIITIAILFVQLALHNRGHQIRLYGRHYERDKPGIRQNVKLRRIPARLRKTAPDYDAGLAPNHPRLAQCTGERL